MTVGSRILGRLAGLPPARTRAVAVERDLAMEADDGVVLLADHWYPDDGSTLGRVPVVLLRSPYGRRQLGFAARLFAERGYQVVVQSCRGTFGSGGEFDPFRHEQVDGHRALKWLSEQPWWSGSVATFGPSYLGLTQWAVAGDPPPELRALALDITSSRFRDGVVYPGGSFALETGGTWLYLLEHQERGLPRVLAAQLRAGRRLAPGYATLPLAEAESAVLGRRVAFYQDWLEHERPGDPWWDPFDFGRDVGAVPPATMVGGWYDIFLPAQVDDYAALVAAGRSARLTIGPWTHNSPRGAGAAIRDALEWFDGQVAGRADRLRRDPVRLWVMGAAGRWVDLPSWPPPADTVRWHLQPGGGLHRSTPTASAPDRYRWDPADPTPSAGGPSLNAATAGRRDQKPRESRSDVVCFTSEPLSGELTVAGPLTAEIWLRSSRWNTDVFVRLCDVDTRGRSTNVSDGILRLEPGDGGVVHTGSVTRAEVTAGGDGVARVRIGMWPTAFCFGRGHRIRLQVSAGAHPLFARNLGGGERLGAGTTLVVADHAIYHDPEHPSAIELPHARL